MPRAQNKLTGNIWCSIMYRDPQFSIIGQLEVCRSCKWAGFQQCFSFFVALGKQARAMHTFHLDNKGSRVNKPEIMNPRTIDQAVQGESLIMKTASVGKLFMWWNLRGC